MKLQAAPIALLGLFGLKHEGQNPSEFNPVVTPVVNISDFYLLPGRTAALDTTTTVAAGTLQEFGPPENEAWRVTAIGVQVVRLVADIAVLPRVALYVLRGGGPERVPIGTLNFGATVATALSQRAGILLPHPLYLVQGDSLGGLLEVGLTAGAGAEWSVLADVQRFQT